MWLVQPPGSWSLREHGSVLHARREGRESRAHIDGVVGNLSLRELHVRVRWLSLGCGLRICKYVPADAVKLHGRRLRGRRSRRRTLGGRRTNAIFANVHKGAPMDGNLFRGPDVRIFDIDYLIDFRHNCVIVSWGS